MDLPTLIDECGAGASPVTVAAIIQIESATHPFAVNLDASDSVIARQPASADEAKELSYTLLNGGYRLKLGLMQVKDDDMPQLGLTLDSVFDPCTNIRAGVHVLQTHYRNALANGYEGDSALKAALSAYHTGTFRRDDGINFANNVYSTAYTTAKTMKIDDGNDPFCVTSEVSWTAAVNAEAGYTPGWQLIETLRYGPDADAKTIIDTPVTTTITEREESE